MEIEAKGVTLIKEDQCKGIEIDPVTKEEIGVITTKEKGGKVGDVLIPSYLYEWIESYFETQDYFQVKYQAYTNDIRETCLKLNITPQGSHGFRWTFA